MKRFKKVILMLIGVMFSIPAIAQTSELPWVMKLQELDASELTLMIILAVVLGVIILLLILMIYLMSFMVTVLRQQQGVSSVPESTWWDSFKKKYIVGKMKPVGSKEEKDLMLDHSYDGIVELDNHMPPWLAGVFYITIAFAVAYFTYYTVLGMGQNQIEEYETELAIAAIKAEEYKALALSSIDEHSVVFDSSTPAINAGKSIYEANCAACHAADGGGGVGPNLTDEYWLHGGNIADIFKVIKYGVVEKGMIPWQDQLSPEQIQQVSSYILTLQGTTPANPKEPQGEMFEPAIEEPLDALTEDELELVPTEEEEN
ncbi:cbb3-type cytochrome c oxidase N-terminal domain-containing protein [Belliella kenyensis]|uniref:Cbb3-type cytochrome c oxidase N-terminal domain-containing protein n=1 Tax=Belliella kenyensis TaxID=1472724 RepID=A0ABV8EME9_9BACT|nr:cbb3-type cytochrome c oxidase N-terminal domain-containing protein [Belliella kenyensis]MCH7400670.1 c-type cytochrome [Belliella kenyensis]MDN3602043.1 c-type cytochrome [Belliella kenyensis]